MDGDEPIAYPLLRKGVAVRSSEGEQIGTVHHVVAAEEQDIFHGLVISTDRGQRFVAAADVASLHEHGVELRIGAEQARSLPAPGGGAPDYAADPGALGGFGHWINRLLARKDWRRRG